jgi:hypothetical protein
MPPDSFLGRFGVSTAFLVAILLFLLPFTEIRCNDQPFASNTGLGLALGRDYKVNNDVNSISSRFSDKSSSDVNTNNENGKLYPAALAALLLGITGFIFSLVVKKSTVISILTSLLAACALIILLAQIKHEVHDKSIDPDQIGGLDRSIKIIAVFTVWYYISLISFLAAAFLSYQQWQGTQPDTDNSDELATV